MILIYLIWIASLRAVDDFSRPFGLPGAPEFSEFVGRDVGPGLDYDLTKQDQMLAKLPVAVDAAFDSYHHQHEPICINDTRVDLLSQIQKWSIYD